MASIQKRGSKRRAQVRQVGHPTLSGTFKTPQEAVKWARTAEVKVDRGQRVDTGHETFNDLLDAYTAHLEQHGSIGRSKRQALGAIKHEFGMVKLRGFTVPLIVGYANARRKQGAGPPTILQDLSYVGTALRHGGALIGADPTQLLAVLDGARRVMLSSGAVARPQERHRRPTKEELEQLFAYWREREAGGRVQVPMPRLVKFCIATAMRISEVCRLEWVELDATARTILIRDRKHPRSKQGNDQRVPLLSSTGFDALALIEMQRGRLLETRGLLGKYFFPYSAGSVSTLFTRAASACGIQDLHLHDLRHEGCSRLFEAGLSIEQVALVSGHKDWNMLRRYAEITAEHVVELERDGAQQAEVVPLRVAK